MEKNDMAKVLEANPKVDRTAVDRGREAAKQLANVGIKLGGYRLEPALGGTAVRHPGRPLGAPDVSSSEAVTQQSLQ